MRKHVVIAELSWPKSLSDQANARSVARRWAFDRLGSLRKFILAKASKGDEPLARMKLDLIGEGEFFFAKGSQDVWIKQGVFCDHWIPANELQESVLEIRAGLHWFNRMAVVTLHAQALDHYDLYFLIMMSWSITVPNMDDAAPGGAAAEAAAAGAA